MLRVGRHPVRVDELDAGEPYRLDAVVNLGHGLVVLLGGDRDLQQTVFSLYWSLKRRSIRRFLITEKAPSYSRQSQMITCVGDPNSCLLTMGSMPIYLPCDFEIFANLRIAFVSSSKSLYFITLYLYADDVMKVVRSVELIGLKTWPIHRKAIT